MYGNNILCYNKHFICENEYKQIFFSYFIYSIPFVLMILILIKINNNLDSLPMIIILSFLYVLVIFLMLRGGFTDPGIIPRMKDYYHLNQKMFLLKKL